MVNPQYLAPEADAFCAVISRERGEPLYGTALHSEVWLLLEYNGPWTAKATTDNELQPEVQAWLAHAAAVTQGRVQFIKQGRTGRDGTISFFVALTRQSEPRLYRYELATYEALLAISISALVDGEGEAAAQRYNEPLLLVCTNGRRDRCCTLFGMGVYHTLRALAGDAVWQTTHVGGHRFAANVLSLPDGLYYGRLQNAADAQAVYEAHARGEIALEYLRGLSSYEEAVQAADYFLRQERGERRPRAFRLQSATWSDEVLEAQFVGSERDERYLVRVQQESLEFPVYDSCGKPGEGACTGFRLLGIEE